MSLGDGIELFKARTDPGVFAGLLGDMTIWVDPATFRRLPIWAPFTSRKAPLFKSDWEERQTNKGEPKFEGNVAANIALTVSLGLSKSDRRNWSCCHIWGNDDDSYQSGQSEVNDPRYFSCLANVVLVPSPLRTFTDTIPEVKSALRFVACQVYGFCPDGKTIPKSDDAGDYLPSKWRKMDGLQFGNLSDKIRRAQDRQVQKLIKLQKTAGSNYPREQVSGVVKYWLHQHPDSLLDGFFA